MFSRSYENKTIHQILFYMNSVERDVKYNEYL
jgi:hypothetical protein